MTSRLQEIIQETYSQPGFSGIRGTQRIQLARGLGDPEAGGSTGGLANFESDAAARQRTSRAAQDLQRALLQPNITTEERERLKGDLKRLIFNDEEDKPWYSNLLKPLEVLSRPLQLVNAAIVDFAGLEEGDEEIKAGDYWDIVTGDYASLAEKLPETAGQHGDFSSSVLLSRLGWGPDGSWWNRALRFGVDFGLAYKFDPLSRLSRGAAGRGRSAAAGAFKTSVARLARDSFDEVLARRGYTQTGARAARDVLETRTPRAAKAGEEIIRERLAPVIEKEVNRRIDDIAQRFGDEVLEEGLGPLDKLEIGEIVQRSKDEIVNTATREVASDTISAIGAGRYSQIDPIFREAAQGLNPVIPSWTIPGGWRIGKINQKGAYTIPGTIEIGDAVRPFTQGIKKTFKKIPGIEAISKKLVESSSTAWRPAWFRAMSREGYGYEALKIHNTLTEFDGLVKVPLASDLRQAAGELLEQLKKEGVKDTDDVLNKAYQVVESHRGASPAELMLEFDLPSLETAGALRKMGESLITIQNALMERLRRYDPNIGDITNYAPRVQSDVFADVVRVLARAPDDLLADVPDELRPAVQFLNELVGDHGNKLAAATPGEPSHARTRTAARVAGQTDPELPHIREALPRSELYSPGGVDGVTNIIHPKVFERLNLTPITPTYYSVESVNEALTHALRWIDQQYPHLKIGRHLKRADFEPYVTNPLKAWDHYINDMAEAIKVHEVASVMDKMGMTSLRVYGDGKELNIHVAAFVLAQRLQGAKPANFARQITRILGYHADESDSVTTIRVGDADVDMPTAMMAHPEVERIIKDVKSRMDEYASLRGEADAQINVVRSELIARGFSHKTADVLANSTPREFKILFEELKDVNLRTAGEYHTGTLELRRGAGPAHDLVSLEDVDAAVSRLETQALEAQAKLEEAVTSRIGRPAGARVLDPHETHELARIVQEQYTERIGRKVERLDAEIVERQRTMVQEINPTTGGPTRESIILAELQAQREALQSIITRQGADGAIAWEIVREFERASFHREARVLSTNMLDDIDAMNLMDKKWERTAVTREELGGIRPETLERIAVEAGLGTEGHDANGLLDLLVSRKVTRGQVVQSLHNATTDFNADFFAADIIKDRMIQAIRKGTWAHEIADPEMAELAFRIQAGIDKPVGRPKLFLSEEEAIEAYERAFSQSLDIVESSVRKVSRSVLETTGGPSPHARPFDAILRGEDPSDYIRKADPQVWDHASEVLGFSQQGKFIRPFKDRRTGKWGLSIWDESESIANGNVADTLNDIHVWDKRWGSLLDKADEVERVNDGFSHNPFNDLVLEEGDDLRAVALAEPNRKVSVQEWETDRARILEEFAEDNRELLTSREGAVIGVWHNGDSIDLDVSVLVYDNRQAWEIGIENGQATIWDNARGDVFALPTAEGRDWARKQQTNVWREPPPQLRAAEGGHPNLARSKLKTFADREGMILSDPAVLNDPDIAAILESMRAVDDTLGVTRDIQRGVALFEGDGGAALNAEVRAAMGQLTEGDPTALHTLIWDTAEDGAWTLSDKGRALSWVLEPDEWVRFSEVAEYSRVLAELGPDGPAANRGLRRELRRAHDFQLKQSEFFKADIKQLDKLKAEAGMLGEFATRLSFIVNTITERGSIKAVNTNKALPFDPNLELWDTPDGFVRSLIKEGKKVVRELSKLDITPLYDDAGDFAGLGRGKALSKAQRNAMLDTFNKMMSEGVQATPPRRGVNLTIRSGPFADRYATTPLIDNFLRGWLDITAGLWDPTGRTAFSSFMRKIILPWRQSVTVSRPITFNIRNLMGGIANGMHWSVGLKEYGNARHAIKFTRTLNNKGLDAALAQLPAELQDAYRAATPHIFRGSFAQSHLLYLLEETGRAPGLRGVLSQANPFSPHFVVARGGAATMRGIENYMRMAVFLKEFDAGDVLGSTRRAVDAVNSVHFDYGDLTIREKAFRDITPFYVWMKNNTMLQMRTLFERPEMILRYQKLMKAAQNNFGGEDNDAYEYVSPPDWWSPWATPTGGFLRKDSPYWAQMWWNPDLPVNDLLRVPFFSEEGMSWNGWFNYAINSVAPQYSAAIEFGREGFDTTAPVGLKQVVGALDFIGIDVADKSTDGRTRVSNKYRNLWNIAFPWMADIVEPLLIPEDERRAQRLGFEPGDRGVGARLRGLGFQQARGVGVSLLTPAETPSQAYQAEQTADRVRSDLALRDEYVDLRGTSSGGGGTRLERLRRAAAAARGGGSRRSSRPTSGGFDDVLSRIYE